MKRAVLVLLAFAPLVLFACTRHPAPKQDAIVLRAFAGDVVLQPVLARFETENPGLHVKLDWSNPPRDPDSSVTVDGDGLQPDLCLYPAERMPALLASGALGDWSAGVADLRDSLRGWPACMVGDAIYGLPFELDAPALCWNPWVFAAAGLDRHRAPATWADVHAAALRLAKHGHGTWALGIATDDSLATFADFAPWALGAGGSVAATGAEADSALRAGNRAALAFLASLHGVRYAPRNVLEHEFALGRIGMLAGDGDSQRSIERFMTPMAPAVAPMPRAAADSASGATLASVAVLASPANARHKEGALRLARFLVRASSELALHRNFDYGLPSSIAAESSLAAQQGPAVRGRSAQLASLRYPPPAAHWRAMRGALGAAVSAALAGHVAPDSALAQAEARIGALSGRR